MSQSFLPAIAATGFTVAFCHAAIPTHWLPFVLTARVQKWNKSKTLLITMLAGLEKLKLAFLEKYERGIRGGLLCLLRILVIVFEH